jgi:hypothetical protein
MAVACSVYENTHTELLSENLKEIDIFEEKDTDWK